MGIAALPISLRSRPVTPDPLHTYPLSPLQSGMLFNQLREPDAGIDIEQIGCTLVGVDVERFVQAWDALARRHDPLRTRFRWRGVDAPLQEVLPEPVLSVHQEDLSALTPEARRQRIEEYIDADRRAGFKLDALPLFRLAFFRMAEGTHEFLWSFPHIILDGRSFIILLRELMEFYSALEKRREPRLAPVRPYGDFIAWLERRDLEPAKQFWATALAGFDTPVFPDLGAPAQRDAREYAERALRLSREETSALYEFVKRHELTVNTMVQGAWAMLLARYARSDDVAFGATRANRRTPLDGDPAVTDMVGLFINTLPVRVRITPEQPVVEWLRQIRRDQMAVRDVEHTPLTVVQGASVMPSGVPLFDTILVFENQRQTVSFDAIDPARMRDFYFREKTTFPISVRGYGEAELLLRIEYYTARFDHASVERMLGHLAVLLREMVAKWDQPTRTLELLTDAERHHLLHELNPAAALLAAGRAVEGATMPAMFTEQAARTPDAVALQFGDSTMTYRELDARAETLGRALSGRGVKPGVLVGLCVERSMEMFVALMGIHKAGGAHLPLDPEYPAERLAYMLADARCALLITDERTASSNLTTLASHSAANEASTPDLLVMDRDWGAIERAAASVAAPSLAGYDDLAYVIYTSGSTGKPKGVQIEHRGLANLMRSMQREPGIVPTDAMLAVTTISFDMAVPELFLPLMVGARIVVAPRNVAVDGQALEQLIERARVTIVQATPVTWRMLLEVGWTNPRSAKLLCGGEAMPASLADALLAGRGELWNMYGPTETTVWSAADLVTGVAADSVAPVGHPMDETTFYVLDASMRPVPLGVPGELHIGGSGVARGYLNRPELTAERFVEDPFAVPQSAPRNAHSTRELGSRAPSGTRFYKTGDLVRYRADGRLDFLGRMDGQVKLRGYRIELGEIEATLVALDVVRNAAVVLRTDAGSEPRLVAYYVAADGASTSPAELRSALARTLPSHMVPSAIMELAELPITPTGKIDRKALPAPDTTMASEGSVAPRDDVEARVLRIWEQVLGTNGISVTDVFNEVGGHSLAAVKVFSRIEKEFGSKIQLSAMLKHDTVEKMATLLRDQRGAATGVDDWHCIVPFDTPGTGTPVFCAHPMSGNVLFYQYFAREIGRRHPVYGIQALGNWGNQDPPESIEEMIEYYVQEIRKVRPHGPYIFFGVSLGGIIAVELARHMRECGEEVTLVVLYDTAAPGYPRYNLYGRVVHFVRNHGGIGMVRLRQMFVIDPPNARDRSMFLRTPRLLFWNFRQTAKWWYGNTRRDFLYWRFERRNPPREYELPPNLTRFRLATRRILRRYRPEPYAGTLTLFRAESQPAGIAHDPTNGWGPIASEVEVHTFKGGHLTGMRPPDVTRTAQVFLECVEEAERADAGRGANAAAGGALPGATERAPARR